MKRIPRDCLVHAYGPDNPVRLRVASGETFVLETHDRFSGWLNSPEPPDVSSPALMGVTGAVAVDGAVPGDVLAIDVLEISFTDKLGIINAIPGKGAFSRFVERFEARRVPIAQGGIPFAGMKVPLRPMVGRVGTAPADRSVPSIAPGPHGGNLDVREIAPGSTVYLPVFVPGALVSAGDVHATMGDGESMVSGVEATADVVLRCRLVDRDLARRLAIEHPVVRTPERLLAVASGRTLDEAAHLALGSLHSLLCRRLGLSPIDAGMLISVAADVGVAQIVNPLITAKVSVPLDILDLE